MLFNEPKLLKWRVGDVALWSSCRFSALQRAEIAEIVPVRPCRFLRAHVSVLFNEPKLLKFVLPALDWLLNERFSALQRAEIAEIVRQIGEDERSRAFQCSSTSRNC